MKKSFIEAEIELIMLNGDVITKSVDDTEETDPTP